MLDQDSSVITGGVPRGKVAGIAIALSAALTIAAVARHPSIAPAHGPAAVFAQLIALSVVDEVVHGVLIVMVGALLFGLTVFSMRRGLHREHVLAGLIAYALASCATIGAALIDGFLVPALAARYAAATPASAGIALDILAACAATIQVLTKFGIGATALAVTLWSAGLVRSAGALRTTGIVGFASEALSIAVLVFVGHLNPHSLGAIVIVQSIWYCAIGALLIRGDL